MPRTCVISSPCPTWSSSASRTRIRPRRETRGRGGPAAHLHRPSPDALEDAPRLRGRARPASADGGHRARPARSGRSLHDGEAHGAQRDRGGVGRRQGRSPRPLRRGPARPALPAVRPRAREILAAGRFGPLSHIYVRINRPGPARYPAWDCPWMLDPAEAGGGSLRNLGSHGMDMFLHLTGEDAKVTGAQVSRRAHQAPVEDYASVMLRSASGVLGTVEVGNNFPRDGTDGEWKIAGRDAILTSKDGVLKLATAAGDETLPSGDITTPYYTTLRDILDHWQRGAPPPSERARLPARGPVDRRSVRASGRSLAAGPSPQGERRFSPVARGRAAPSCSARGSGPSPRG